MYYDEFHDLGASLASKLAGSAGYVQPAELSNYCYEEMRMSMEQIADPTFPRGLFTVRTFKRSFTSIRELKLDCRNGMITAT